MRGYGFNARFRVSRLQLKLMSCHKYTVACKAHPGTLVRTGAFVGKLAEQYVRCSWVSLFPPLYATPPRFPLTNLN